MKSIILAGGKGSKLSPITCSIPPVLIPICGRPVIEYTLDLLEQHGIKSSTISVMSKGQKVEDNFYSKKYNSIDLDFSYEETPLGTAGSVKHSIQSTEEDFIVISGRCVSDFDLTKAFKFHKNHHGIATIILKKDFKNNNSKTVKLDSNNKIQDFTENFSSIDYSSNFINTGIYIFSKEILDHIPDSINSDFIKDIFPSIIKKNIPIYGYKADGYCQNLYDIKSYFKINQDVLHQKVSCDIKAKYDFGVYFKDSFPNGEFNINPPVFIGSNVSIGDNVQLNCGTVVMDNVTIGDETIINSSIILEGAHISSHVKINQAVIGNDAKILHHSSIFEESVIANECKISEHSIISNKAKIWPNKTVFPNSNIKKDIKYGYPSDILFDDDGISGETNLTINPENLSAIGGALASLIPKPKIGISTNLSPSSHAFKHAVISGILSSGGDVLDFGDTIETQFEFCVSKSMCDFGVYIESNAITNIKIVQQGSMPLSRLYEKKIEDLINQTKSKKVLHNNFGMISDFSSLKNIYEIDLASTLPLNKTDYPISIKSPNKHIVSILSRTLKKSGYTIQDSPLSIEIYISNSGKEISIYSQETGYIFDEKVLAVLCLATFIKGNSVSVPFEAPTIIDKIGKKYEKDVYRYHKFSNKNLDSIAREKAISQPHLRDCLKMSISLLNFLNENNYTLKQAIDMIPHFATASRMIKVAKNPMDIFDRISSTGEIIDSGLKFNHTMGEAFIRPLKSGKGFMVYAESIKSESASEICDFYEDLIKQQTI